MAGNLPRVPGYISKHNSFDEENPPPIPFKRFREKNKAELIAIYVRNAYKKYGLNDYILNGLNLTLHAGNSYALLGSSGCGKTTLLTCAIGIRPLTGGIIKIFGCHPGSQECGIPGSRIGYMPQDMGLFGEFTIKDAIFYFGRISGMENSRIYERMKFLLNLINMPDSNRLISTLSGGQQRRVSFAVALLHEPELLILDEPTVGVDPLLRHTIWKHLMELAGKTTILITTHYIEEAKNVSMIGVMRGGRMLIEDSPNNILLKFNLNLEQIIIKLCELDELKKIEGKYENKGPSFQHRIQGALLKKTVWNSKSSLKQRLKALIIRNFLRLQRNFGFLIFLFIFPSIAAILFCLAIGGDFQDLNFGVINSEVPEINGCSQIPQIGCQFAIFSCRFIDFLPISMLNVIQFTDKDAALQQVKEGKLWGYMIIPQNFTENFIDIDDEDEDYYIDKNSIQNKLRIKMDMTNQQIALQIQKAIFDAFMNFINDFIKKCADKNIHENPIFIEDPIYGRSDTNFTEYIAPSFLIIMCFFMSTSLSALLLVLEKKQGMYERNLVQGITKIEIIVSHFVSQYGIMLIQTLCSVFIVIVVFQIPVVGDLYIVILLNISIGTLGILFGFFISSICTQEDLVMQLVIGLIMPTFILSGFMWPIEGMPLIMQYISLLTPLTFTNESMRSIMSRGWGITHPSVYNGFLSSFVWIVILALIIIILDKMTTRRL